LSGYASAKASGVMRAIGAGRKRTRRKATPKYRSRKNPKIVWSGRGVTPVWMRDEMKGTKLKKDDFLIAKA
jgi:DNA-binding protein H-NS